MTVLHKQLLALAAAIAAGSVLARRRGKVRLTGGLTAVRGLQNGNQVAIDQDGLYVECEDGNGSPLDDSACASVLTEHPDVDVPITARIRMTVGRVL